MKYRIRLSQVLLLHECFIRLRFQGLPSAAILFLVPTCGLGPHLVRDFLEAVYSSRMLALVHVQRTRLSKGQGGKR